MLHIIDMLLSHLLPPLTKDRRMKLFYTPILLGCLTYIIGYASFSDGPFYLGDFLLSFTKALILLIAFVAIAVNALAKSNYRIAPEAEKYPGETFKKMREQKGGKKESLKKLVKELHEMNSGEEIAKMKDGYTFFPREVIRNLIPSTVQKDTMAEDKNLHEEMIQRLDNKLIWDSCAGHLTALTLLGGLLRSDEVRSVVVGRDQLLMLVTSLLFLSLADEETRKKLGVTLLAHCDDCDKTSEKMKGFPFDDMKKVINHIYLSDDKSAFTLIGSALVCSEILLSSRRADKGTLLYKYFKHLPVKVNPDLMNLLCTSLGEWGGNVFMDLTPEEIYETVKNNTPKPAEEAETDGDSGWEKPTATKEG